MKTSIVLRAGALAVIACLTISATASAQYEDTIRKTFPVNSGGTLFLKTNIGKIAVRPGGRNEVSVTITRIFGTTDRNEIDDILDHLDIDMDQSGDNVTITTEYNQRYRRSFFGDLGRPRLKLDYEITVPETFNLDLKTGDEDIVIGDLRGSVLCYTSDGNIDIGAISGPVTARTSDGDVGLRNASGDVDLQTSDGNIAAGDVSGEVNAKTSDGNITIEHAGGPVQAKTSDGDIRLSAVAGSVYATTSDGNITVAITEQPSKDSRLSTSDGDITILVNPDIRLSIDARTGEGRISANNISLQMSEMSKHRLAANMNGGGPELVIRGSDSGITIRKE